MMQEAAMAVEVTMTGSPLPAQERENACQDLLAFRDRVYCLCLGFAGNAADARDLAQETFAKALAHFPQDRPDNPQAWIMRIARNTCLDLARRKKARGSLHPISEFAAVDWRTPEIQAGHEEEIVIVRKAIARLPRRLRDVLVLREYAEFSYQEIALELGIGSGTVMSRLNRARQAVIRYYREEHHGSKP
jgi:RNA polymerase sigma factor (sigma-70 family)